MVFGAYGGHKERPTLRLDWDTPGVYCSYLGFRHLVLTGICFYADTRDPESPTYYVPPGKRVDGHAGILVLLRPESSGENLLVEDCSFRFCMIHIAGRSIRNLVIRRCLYLDSYVPAGGHLMASGGCLIEENVFDHVGWSENPRTHPLGRASMLVHSVYCCDLVGAIFRGNLFLRSSSIGIKLTATAPGSSRDVVVDNNLFVEGEIGISMGGNKYLPYRFVNPLIVNNVMLDLGRARPTGRDLGWGLSIENWDGGLVANNLFAHQASDKVLNAYAIAIRGQGTRNVAVRDNVIHGLKTRSAGIVLGQGDDKAGGIVLKDNLIQFPGRPSPLIRLEGTAAGYQLSGNTYWSGADPNAWFVAGSERKPLSLQAFTQLTQDPKASAREVQFPDPTRTVEAYNAHVGGQATFEDFLAQVRGQSRANWRREYTAGAVNDWVRAGFGMKRRPILYQEAKGTEEERD
jgi:hypothetical protein